MTAITLVKTITGSCDGRCGGETTLTTDDATHAYAVSHGGWKYSVVDAEQIVRYADGQIVVACGSIHVESDERCDGTTVFTRADLAAAHCAPSTSAEFFAPMDVGQ